MASNYRGIIEQLKVNKKNRTYEELKRILEDAGFSMHPRTAGSHRVFHKPGCSITPDIPEKKGPLLVCYVRMVIVALEECSDD